MGRFCKWVDLDEFFEGKEKRKRKKVKVKEKAKEKRGVGL